MTMGAEKDLKPRTSGNGSRPAGTQPRGRGASYGGKPAVISRPSLSQVLLPVGTAALLVLIWDLMVRGDLVNPIIVPAPGEVLLALVHLLEEEFFWHAVGVTMTETMYGFAAAVAIGMILGALVGVFPLFRKSVYPLIVTFQNMPRIALAPVFLTWFGFGLTSKVVMAATIAFFPVVINTVVGLESVDRNGKLLMQSFGVSRWELFRHLTLPTAAPYIFAGLKTALTLALLGAIVAEFVGASEGLGVLIKQFNFELNVDYGFAVVFFLALVGLILYGAIEVLDRKLIFWRSDSDN